MPLGVRKKADSLDYRGWNYLRHWQEWQPYMPPWQYSFKCRTIFEPNNLPFWDVPFVFNKVGTGPDDTATVWSSSITLPDTEPPYTQTPFDFHASIAVVPEDNPFPDPDGHPFTLTFSGYWDIPGLERASFTGYYNKPPYLEIFTIIVREPGGDEHPFYPFGIQAKPVIWNHPLGV